MGIVVWQVWNEPNLTQNWDGAWDPSQYGDLLRETRLKIRALGINTRVLNAALGENAYPQAFMDGVIASAGKCSFDAFAAHPYGHVVGGGTASRTAHTRTEAWRTYLNSRGIPSSVPIWVTEVGWSAAGPVNGDAGSGYAGDPTAQDASLREYANWYQGARSTYNLGPLFYFSLRDSGLSGQWHEYTGLKTFGGSPRPAYANFTQRAQNAYWNMLPVPPQRPVTC